MLWFWMIGILCSKQQFFEFVLLFCLNYVIVWNDNYLKMVCLICGLLEINW